MKRHEIEDRLDALIEKARWRGVVEAELDFFANYGETNRKSVQPFGEQEAEAEREVERMKWELADALGDDTPD